eukprot:CAMPEP_0172596514 /NCGR_PEP_ID=MMETSP1068-20121228/16325_1 /TAXON_ID=35684 /ORGANISM="Pseudopedinella elastica, Strain CCMP716" /LENGTH=464 /DNA_ID=CAMNT_0013395585 /DNA_START=132 /DNA_END=1526 /DNA_ORIENTATION=+
MYQPVKKNARSWGVLYSAAQEPANRGEDMECTASDCTKAWRTLAVPLAVLVIAGMILFSQLQLAFETRYEYHYEMHYIKEDGMGETYSYNLWKGAQQLRDEGATELAAMVILWSGIFPYIKLVLIAVVDWLGRGKKPVSKGWGFLSVVAKWSFMDVWIVAMTVLCVRIHINKTQWMHSWGLARKLHLKIWTQAVVLQGCLFFAWALVLSQALGHWVIQRAVHASRAETRQEHPPPQKVMKPLLILSSTMGLASPAATLATSAALVASLVGLLSGILSPFMHIEYLLHIHIQKQFVINEDINSDLINTYSVMSGIEKMYQRNHIEGENLWIGRFVLWFVVIAPLVRSVGSNALWFLPLPHAARRLIAFTTDAASVVAAAEVFGVSAWFMIWQLPKMFDHMEEAARYIDLNMSACSGLYLLIFSGFLDTLATKVVQDRFIDTLHAPEPKPEPVEAEAVPFTGDGAV